MRFAARTRVENIGSPPSYATSVFFGKKIINNGKKIKVRGRTDGRLRIGSSRQKRFFRTVVSAVSGVAEFQTLTFVRQSRSLLQNWAGEPRKTGEMDGADGSLVVGQDGGGEVIEVTTVDASHVPVVLDADLCEGGHGDVVVTVVGEIPHELTEQIESGQSMVVVQEVVGVVDPDDREDEDDDAGEDPDAMLEGLEGLAGVDDGVGEDGDEDEDGLDEEDMMDDSTLKFHCPACERIFDRKNAFYGHLRGHTDVIFRCDQEGCMQEFFTLAKLRRHQKEEHDSERPFKCNRCTKAFTRQVLEHLGPTS